MKEKTKKSIADKNESKTISAQELGKTLAGNLISRAVFDARKELKKIIKNAGIKYSRDEQAKFEIEHFLLSIFIFSRAFEMIAPEKKIGTKKANEIFDSFVGEIYKFPLFKKFASFKIIFQERLKNYTSAWGSAYKGEVNSEDRLFNISKALFEEFKNHIDAKSKENVLFFGYIVLIPSLIKNKLEFLNKIFSGIVKIQ